MLKAIIFDFDGVILDSVKIKVDAFTKIFDDYSDDIVKEIDDYNRTCGAISRYNKIKYCYKNIINSPLSEDILEIRANKYGRITIDGVKNSPFILGAKEFIKKYSNKLDLYIVSATPQDDLEEIVKYKGITKYFKGIYGTKYSKVDSIKEIIRNWNYNYDEIVYIGDSISDLIDAKKSGIKFGGKGEIFNIEFVINDLTELGEYIK